MRKITKGKIRLALPFTSTSYLPGRIRNVEGARRYRNVFSGWFRASASRIRGEGGVARLQMQTKLFAAGLINVNHQPIVMKLPLKSFVWTTLPIPRPTAAKSPEGGWPPLARCPPPLTDGFTFVHKAAPPTSQFSRSFSPRPSLCRADFFLFFSSPSPHARDGHVSDHVSHANRMGRLDTVLNSLLTGCFFFFSFFFENEWIR